MFASPVHSSPPEVFPFGQRQQIRLSLVQTRANPLSGLIFQKDLPRLGGTGRTRPSSGAPYSTRCESSAVDNRTTTPDHVPGQVRGRPRSLRIHSPNWKSRRGFFVSDCTSSTTTLVTSNGRRPALWKLWLVPDLPENPRCMETGEIRSADVNDRRVSAGIDVAAGTQPGPCGADDPGRAGSFIHRDHEPPVYATSSGVIAAILSRSARHSNRSS